MKPLGLFVVLSLFVRSAPAQTAEELIGAIRSQRERAAAPRPLAVQSVDLSRQISAAANPPNQGNIGDCHAFGSAAVLSAAYYRHSGRKVAFSAGDLFFQNAVLRPGYHPHLAGRPKGLMEGGQPDSDLKWAIEHGLATETEAPYSKIYQSYMSRLKPANLRDMDQADMSGRLTQLLNLEQTPERRESAVKDRERENARQLERNRERIDLIYRQKFPEILEERRRYQAEFQRGRFEILSQSYPWSVKLEGLPFRQGGEKAVLAVGELSRENCRVLGEAQHKFIVDQLDAGRPVVVSMDLGGLASWSGTRLIQQGEGYHAFVILGYEPAPHGLSFMTLNSWGPGNNVPVREDELCRIFGVDTVRVASDAR